MNYDPGKSAEILLVEDNPGDVRLTVEALKEVQLATKLSVARDGAEAMDFLLRRGQHASAVRPDLILLDLNLPKKSGLDVLKEIKSNGSLRKIPVVILTTSNAEADVANGYDFHANCYVTKPVDMDRFMEMIKGVVSFWFGIATLPRQS